MEDNQITTAKGLTLILNSGGLNQFYLNPKEIFVDYNFFQKTIYSRLSFLSIDQKGIDTIINDTLSKNKTRAFNEIVSLIEHQLSQYIKDKQEEVNLRELLSISDYQTNEMKYLNEMAGKYEIIIKVPNSICLFFETLILTELHFPSSLIVVDSSGDNEKLNTDILSNPKNYFVFDYDLEILYQYHLIGAWTAYLTNYIKIQSKNDLESSYYKLNLNNLNMIRSKGVFFNYSLFFVIQMVNYCSLIEKTSTELSSSKSDGTILAKARKELHLINCLVIYRYLFKVGEIKRAHLFICNNKVNYIAYIGSIGQDSYDDLLDLSCNSKERIDCLLGKFSEVQELNRFEKMIKSIQAYCKAHKDFYSINSLDQLDKFLLRDKMISFMKDYCKLDQVTKLTKGSLAFPLSFSEALLNVYTYDQLTSYMKKNQLKLPLIMKYTGPKLDYNHLLINIISEEGLKNYIPFIQSFTKGDEGKISVVMQSFVNHGGYVIKLYRIHHKSYIFYRPSIPDAKEELVSLHEEYQRGFYQTTTSHLVTEEYKSFWKKISHNSKVKELVDEEYLNALADIFEEYSENNLIGLDFLYDYEENVYYLIDVNCFPGYKELIGEFNDLISNHVEYYTNCLNLTNH